MKIHEMKLGENPFFAVKSGRQKIEGRICDEKRSKIGLGDTIRFYSLSGGKDFFDTKVAGLRKYNNFADMFLDLGPEIFGCDKSYSLSDFVSAYRKYYSEEDEKRFGVLGIELEVLK